MTGAVLAAALAVAAAYPPGVAGELVAADFVHRAGQFRTRDAGELVAFVLPPEGVVRYLAADADLRDVPLGTGCRFHLLPNAQGQLTRLVLLEAESTADAAATDRQRRTHAAFIKDRGVPARVERPAGRTLTLTMLGGSTPADRFWDKEFAAGRDVAVAVANDELRTWNPPVDQERGKVVGVADGGRRLTVTVNFMLEGFRRGRVVRVLAGGWPVKDQPFGEQLFHYGNRALPAELAELPPKEYPGQFPFRTDFGNDRLPWYRLRPGVTPPPYSEHAVFGELASADPGGRAGRFLADRTGAAVEFSLLPEAAVRYLGAAAGLADIPPGTRCRFGLFQDESGAFTRAGSVADEATELVGNGVVWRVTELMLEGGKLYAARQPPGVMNDQGDPEQPPDTGRAELRVGPETRVWKGDRRVPPGDLAVGDVLLVNRSGERPGHPAVCTDVWVGAVTHKLVTERQARKAPAPKR